MPNALGRSTATNTQRIKELRAERGWTQYELAEKAGLSKRTVENAEVGKRVSLPTLKMIAEAFGVSVKELHKEQLEAVAASKSKLFALLFTDIVGSTSWKQKLGDHVYTEQLLDPHNRIFRKSVEQYHGSLERSFTGDGFLATFATASDAVRCSLDFHRAIRETTWDAAIATSIESRVGIHVGEGVEYDDAKAGPQVSGLAVNVAARIMGLAMGRQTLLTRHAYDDARQNVRDIENLRWMTHDSYRFNGINDAMEVFEVGIDGASPFLLPPDGEKAKRDTDAVPLAPAGPLLATTRDLPNFIGREVELATIMARLESGGSVNISAVRAQGGMGKTWLAERVAQLVKERFPIAIKLALNGLSDTPTTAVQAMKDVIARFRPTPEALPNTVVELRPRYLAVLARHKPLVILDNARDGKQIEDLIHERPEGVGFIITSRKLIVLRGIETVPLDKLSEVEAIRLIRNIAGETRGTDEEIREVATLCSRLPLALHVAATFLRVKSNWTVSRYLEALKKKRLEMLKLDGEENVEAVLALSVTHLIHDDAEQAARLQALSVFPGDFDDAAAAAVWGFDDVDIAFEQLDNLLSRSLILEAEGGRWELHDLFRPIAQQAFVYVEDGHPLKGTGASRIALAQQCHAEHYVALCGGVENCGSWSTY